MQNVLVSIVIAQNAKNLLWIHWLIKILITFDTMFTNILLAILVIVGIVICFVVDYINFQDKNKIS